MKFFRNYLLLASLAAIMALAVAAGFGVTTAVHAGTHSMQNAVSTLKGDVADPQDNDANATCSGNASTGNQTGDCADSQDGQNDGTTTDQADGPDTNDTVDTPDNGVKSR